MQETKPEQEEKKQSAITNLISSLNLNFFKKSKQDTEKVKLKENVFNDPALSTAKLSLKNELVNESTFTKNSKLTSHSIDTDVLKRNQKKFKKYVNEKGESD